LNYAGHSFTPTTASLQVCRDSEPLRGTHLSLLAILAQKDAEYGAFLPHATPV